MNNFGSCDTMNQGYQEMPDDDIVLLAQKGDNEALLFILKKYKSFVKGRARSYFLIGADREDIIQEGMIGLYKAIRDFKADKQVTFRAFAEICITRQIITAVKAATRQKNVPLNSYISLNKPVYEENTNQTFFDIFTTDPQANPEDMVIDQEAYNNIELKINKILSPFEMKVLNMYLEGKNYHQMSVDLNRDHKSIDNALQRIKKKLERALKNQAPQK